MDNLIQLTTLTLPLAVVALSYLFAKKQEREADWRKIKLDHYKAFAESLSGIIAGEDSPEGQRVFSKYSNNLNLIASQSVLAAMDQFRVAIRDTNLDRLIHDRLLSNLFYEIRKDLEISPHDDKATFSIKLFASGIKD